jgi:hypothetical protein
MSWYLTQNTKIYFIHNGTHDPKKRNAVVTVVESLTSAGAAQRLSM